MNHRSFQGLTPLFLLIAVSILILFFYSYEVFSAPMTLAWDPNTEPDLAGYKVYFGTGSRAYGSPIDVGNVTTYTLVGLNQGHPYFISVTAYDRSNRESEYSNEVSGVAKEPTQTYTVTTNPSGLEIIVDGVTCTAPQAFNWVMGSTHNVSVSSSQEGGFGARYVYSSWNDGGQQSHTITAPSYSTTYAASFNTECRLTTLVSSPGGGVITPSGTNWYNSGQTISISATADNGYTFSNWTGDLLDTTNPTSITMNGSKNVMANFSQNQYTLTMNINPSGSGSVSKSPNKSTYIYGEQVTLTATTNSGYNLGNWSGDAGGTANPVTLTINKDKTVTANFTPASGSLSVTPSEGLSASGNLAGPFSPSSQTYTLLNTGVSEVDWKASKDQNWISLSLSNGSLAPGMSKNVVVSINRFAKRLTAGTYTDFVTFSNVTNGNGNTSILIVLKVDEAVKTNEDGPTDTRSIDGSWIFKISGTDKGGAALWFMNNILYGYGISLENGMFEIEGYYDIDSEGSVKGAYTLYDFQSVDELGRGNFKGKTGKEVTKLKFETKTMNEEILSINMRGSRLSEDPIIPTDRMAKMTGGRKGTIDPLKIEPYQLDNSIYPNVFKVSGPGFIFETGSIDMEGYFFIGQKNKVYGIYQFGGATSEAGVFSGRWNPVSEIFNLHFFPSYLDME